MCTSIVLVGYKILITFYYELCVFQIIHLLTIEHDDKLWVHETFKLK